MRVFIDGRESLASEVAASTFSSRGHEVRWAWGHDSSGVGLCLWASRGVNLVQAAEASSRKLAEPLLHGQHGPRHERGGGGAPPSVITRTSPGAAQVVRPDEGCSAADLQVLALGADLIVLDAAPTAEGGGGGPVVLDRQLGVLAALRHSPFRGHKRLVVLSSVATWARTTPAEEGHPLHEGLYARRAPLAAAAGLRALEDECLRLRGHRAAVLASGRGGGTLDACVVCCGVLVGLGEDLLFPLFLDAWLQVNATPAPECPRPRALRPLCSSGRIPHPPLPHTSLSAPAPRPCPRRRGPRRRRRQQRAPDPRGARLGLLPRPPLPRPRCRCCAAAAGDAAAGRRLSRDRWGSSTPGLGRGGRGWLTVAAPLPAALHARCQRAPHEVRRRGRQRKSSGVK